MATHHATAPARAGERPRLVPAQVGPVTAALRTMRAADPADAAIDAIREGLDRHFAEADRQRVRTLRKAIGDRIEADIALLDALAGDADFEATGDDEPSLCGAGSHALYGNLPDYPQTGGASGGDFTDLEQEDDEETLGWAANVRQIALGPNTADGEQSLGSLGGTAVGCEFGSQTTWAGGARDDREDDAGDNGEPEEDDDRDSGCADMEGAIEQYGDLTRRPEVYA